MAFVSQCKGLRRHGSIIGISVRIGKSGSTICYVPAAIRSGFRFAELELDEVTKQVRVKCGSDSGAKLSGLAGGQFSVSKSFGRKVIPSQQEKTRIALTRSGDGWWYGSYANSSANQNGEQ